MQQVNQAAAEEHEGSPNGSLTAVLTITSAMLVVVAVNDIGPVVGIGNGASAILAILAGLVFLLAHGSAALGWRNLIAFLVITVVVSFTAEALGVATGLVFGPYYYTDQLGPKLLGVPPLIQAAYAGMGYTSLMTARVILGMMRPQKRWQSILAVTVVGALIMVAWDVAMDPYQSTVSGTWIWQTGGPYFGVGIHNYLGWFGTVFVFMLLYQIYASRYTEQPKAGAMSSKAFWLEPILYYALTALGIIVVPLVGGVSLPYASPANYTGTLQALEDSLALVAVYVMGVPVVTAICRLFVNTPPPAASYAERP